MKFPTLYHKGKTGALVQWNIWTGGAYIYTEHGQIGGKLQTTPGKLAEAKNIGKANATTPEEQAISEARSMWLNKLERKYSETKADAQEEVFLPMLAADLKKRKGKGIFYPIDVQVKFDGVRAMAYWENDRVVLGTRGGKEWTAPTHIIEELERVMPPEMVLDGELYIHNVLFEDLSSWSKKQYPETYQLEFHVFDMPIDEMGLRKQWRHRCQSLLSFFKKNALRLKHLKIAEVFSANNEAEVLKLEEKFVEDGYEGAICRNLNGEYLFGHRSNDLLKVKSSVDDEFQIVRFDHGKGKFAKSVTWWCVVHTKNGPKEFKVIPKTTLQKRELLYLEGKQHIGKWLKVRYQNLTEEGIPRFGRSLGFREVEDMS